MMLIAMLEFMLVMLAPAQEAATAPSKGSISGVVRDAGTGTVIEAARVYTMDGPRQVMATTDTQGRFELKDLGPGQLRVAAVNPATRTSGITRILALAPGQDLTGIEFRLPLPGTITGRILDERGESVPDLSVMLVQAQYYFGELRYTIAGIATSDDRGEYRLSNAFPGGSYLVLAKKRPATNMEPVSDAPADPKLRKPVAGPTYYPSSPTVTGAEAITLRPGETREGVDIRLARGPSYCTEGSIDAPAGALFQITEAYPTNGAVASSMTGVRVVIPTPSGKIGPGGKFRRCDLHPGQYQLSASLQSSGSAMAFGTTPITIGNEDVRGIMLVVQQGMKLAGRVVWDGEPPEKPVEARIRILLDPLTRLSFQGEGSPAQASVPGEFSFTSRLPDEYAVRVTGLPRELYIKDLTYAGNSVLNAPLRLGSSLGNQELRILVARDGGYVAASVKDREGNPVPDAGVFVMPASARSEPELASVMVSGQTNQNGAWSTNALAPGKYYVLAGGLANDNSPETIGKLWRARLKAKELAIEPGKTTQVTLEPTMTQ